MTHSPTLPVSLIPDSQFLLRMGTVQLDDMLHDSPFPVMLLPAGRTMLEDSSAQPLLFFTSVSQPSRFRGALYMPTIAGHISELRVSLSETLLWRLYSLVQGVGATGAGGVPPGPNVSVADVTTASGRSTSDARSRMHTAAGGSSSGSLASSSAAGTGSTALQAGSGRSGNTDVPAGSAAVQQVASADLPLQVDLLSLDDLPLRVSFRTDKVCRPRWANSLWLFHTLGDMLNLDDLGLTLPGLELQATRAARSAIISAALKQLQAQALAIVFNVFRCELITEYLTTTHCMLKKCWMQCMASGRTFTKLRLQLPDTFLPSDHMVCSALPASCWLLAAA
jgi:hypothetical protein